MDTDTEAELKGGWQIAIPLCQWAWTVCPTPLILAFPAASSKGKTTNSRGCNPWNVRANTAPTLKRSNIRLLVCAKVRPLQGRDSVRRVTPGFTRCYSRCSPPGWGHGGKVASNACRELEKKSGRNVVTSGNYVALKQASEQSAPKMAELPAPLVKRVRYPSGVLPDDISIGVCRPFHGGGGLLVLVNGDVNHG